MSKRFEVYGIGNAIMDLQLQVSDKDLEALKLMKGGMKLVDEAEQSSLIEYFQGEPLHQASGGSAANTMIAICQLGGSVGYGCLVGNDAFGKFYHDEMAELGVVLDAEPIPGAHTGSCVVLITPDAERTMNTHLGVSEEFGPEHVSEASIRDSEWLYVEGYLFSSEKGQLAAERAIQVAKQSGVKVAVTFSDGFIVNGFRTALDAAVEQADLLFANLNEAELFTGANGEDKIFELYRSSAPNVIMTLGSRGARVAFGGEELRVAGFEVQALDSTGAGDSFAGGFLHGITAGLGVEKATRLACFLASRVVAQVGPRLTTDVRQLVAGVFTDSEEGN